MLYRKSDRADLSARVFETVCTGSVEGIERLLSNTEPLRYSDALVVACRYRGLKIARIVAKYSADYATPCGWSYKVWAQLLSRCSKVGMVFEQNPLPDVLGWAGLKTLQARYRVSEVLWLQRKKLVPANLAEVLLVFAILMLDHEMIDALHAKGVSLGKDTIAFIKSGMCSLWREVQLNITECEFQKIIPLLALELNGAIKLPLSGSSDNRLFTFTQADSLRLIFNHFDLRCVNKRQYIKDAVDASDVERIQILAESGWFNNRVLRDQTIAYSSSRGNAEMTAWLLEFKRTHADLERERRIDEAKQMRELNASPTSVTVMKHLWRFKLTDDNTYTLTRYKGYQPTVKVPSIIGKREVNVLGYQAFCLRDDITDIEVPDTIKKIDNDAFYSCKSLERIIIPENLESLGNWAFSCCDALQMVATPSTVELVSSRRESFGMPTFYLPGSLKKVSMRVIDRRSSSSIVVILGEGITDLTVYNYSAQQFWMLPDSLRTLEFEPLRIFNSPRKLILCVHPGSEAEWLCKENGLNYQFYPEDQMSSSSSLN